MRPITKNCTSCKYSSMGVEYEPDSCSLQDHKIIYDSTAECNYFEPSIFEIIEAIFSRPKRNLPESKPVVDPYKKGT